jgi:hypothetical protein
MRKEPILASCAGKTMHPVASRRGLCCAIAFLQQRRRDPLAMCVTED